MTSRERNLLAAVITVLIVLVISMLPKQNDKDEILGLSVNADELPTVTVVQTKRQIPIGTALETDLIQPKKVPLNSVSADSIKWADLEPYLAKPVISSIAEGDLVQKNHFKFGKVEEAPAEIVPDERRLPSRKTARDG